MSLFPVQIIRILPLGSSIPPSSDGAQCDLEIPLSVVKLCVSISLVCAKYYNSECKRLSPATPPFALQDLYMIKLD